MNESHENAAPFGGAGPFVPPPAPWNLILHRVRATKSDNGVLIRMSHENASKLCALVGDLPADGISVDLYEALAELGYGEIA